jgi:hypothetical protein
MKRSASLAMNPNAPAKNASLSANRYGLESACRIYLSEWEKHLPEVVIAGTAEGLSEPNLMLDTTTWKSLAQRRISIRYTVMAAVFGTASCDLSVHFGENCSHDGQP